MTGVEKGELMLGIRETNMVHTVEEGLSIGPERGGVVGAET